jgi:ubiquinone/menaquinone biosynthesis C-methylase UbiE
MFEFCYSAFVDPTLKDVRIYVAESAGIKAGDLVLDVCCGTGDQLRHYRQKGAITTGVDQDEGMIEVAKEKLKKHGYDDVAFHLASASRLPFPDGHFDFASISLALHEMEYEEREKTVAEMRRVVKKDGILMFIDFKIPLPQNGISYFIRSMEFLAGKENYRCFRDYIVQGGLVKLLEKHQLKPQADVTLKSGNLQIIKASNT